MINPDHDPGVPLFEPFSPERLAYYSWCLEAAAVLKRIAFRDEHWIWLGATTVNGYGYIGRRTMPHAPAHRYFYTLFVAPIPPGLEIDHLCRVKLCVNPNHLEPVTHAENMRRTIHRSVVCPQGHPWTPENSWIDKRGTRWCRTCHREREMARKRKMGVKPKRPSHCPHGHEFSEDNTYRNTYGYRVCRQCMKRKDDARPRKTSRRVGASDTGQTA